MGDSDALTKLIESVQAIHALLEPMQVSLRNLQEKTSAQQEALHATNAGQKELSDQTREALTQLREGQLLLRDAFTAEQQLVATNFTEEEKDKTPKSKDAPKVGFTSESGGATSPTKDGSSNSPTGNHKVSGVERRSAHSGGPWLLRSVGTERGHRRKDGGGDWNVRPIGALLGNVQIDASGKTGPDKEGESEPKSIKGSKQGSVVNSSSKDRVSNI